MTTATSTPTDDPAGTRTVQVHRVYITAPAQRVWDALLSPEWTDRYGYGGFVQSDLRPGSRVRHDRRKRHAGVRHRRADHRR